jgi:hypothetical protein
LVALLGAAAFMVKEQEAARPEPVASTPQKAGKQKAGKQKPPTAEVEKIELVRAESPSFEPEPMRLDPIQNLDMNLFDQLGILDASAAEDLFDLDKLADLVSHTSGRKEISFTEAIEMGVMSNLDSDAKK